MGTRHLICVVQDKEYKVAQYGQWDGYPEGQGTAILNFLQSNDLSEFAGAIRDKAKIESMEELSLLPGINESGWSEVYPHLSRDAGAKILNYIMDVDGILPLKSSLPFAGDSLSCEWAYVIDLDKNSFEVYEGFNHTPLSEDERFASIEGLVHTDGYYPVRLVAAWILGDLPQENEFLEVIKEKTSTDKQ